MRRLAALLVTLAILLAADSVARYFAAARLSDGLRTALDLPQDPSVSIGGFPFLWDLARGDLESMTISTRSVRRGPLALERVKIDLESVRFSPVGALTGDIRSARVAGGNGTARISVVALEDALRAVGGLVGDIGVEAFADSASVSGTTLSLGPVNLELPTLVPGMSYHSARVVDGGVRLAFRLGRTTLKLS